MQSRKIAVGMIEETYDAYRNDWMTQSNGELSYELNKFTGGRYFLIDVIHQRKYLVYNDGELTFGKI